MTSNWVLIPKINMGFSSHFFQMFAFLVSMFLNPLIDASNLYVQNFIVPHGLSLESF